MSCPSFVHKACRSMLGVAAVALVAGSASAGVRLEGAWPDAERAVSLQASGMPRAEAIRKLAASMGWSVVLHAPSTDAVDLQVQDQPAGKVLDVLLSDGDYVARRDGNLISIAREAQPASGASSGPGSGSALDAGSGSAPVPPAAAGSGSVPPAPPAEAAKLPEGEAADRVVTGGNVRVERNETVHDVVVFGGSADVLGTATGDVVVIGGAARVHEGAHVKGDATAVGGSLNIADGARVDGNVGVVGGTLHRGEKAQIGGSDADEGSQAHGNVKIESGEEDEPSSWLQQVGEDIASAVRNSALLFVFGAVLVALAGRRMEALAAEIAARPMRSFALGVVGGLVGALLLVALLVTIIGIPVALVGGILAVVSTYAGICAVLIVAGNALLRHRTPNPYAHLAIGCGLFLLVGAIPYLGGLATAIVVLMGIGGLVATRGAGLFPPRSKQAAGGIR